MQVMRSWLCVASLLALAAVAAAEAPTGTVAGTVSIDFVPPAKAEGEPGYGSAEKPPKTRQERQKEELENVVVYIADDNPTDGTFAGQRYVASASAPAAEITQKDKTFIPHVLAIQQGTTVKFPNEDPFFHNVFSYSKGNTFDLGKYRREDPPGTHVCETPGVIDIFCDIHRTMRAYVVVVEHPFFTRVDAAGKFELEGVPAGHWTLVAWHPLLEIQPKLPVEVKPGQRLSVDVHLVK